jgi:hypothetical protein
MKMKIDLTWFWEPNDLQRTTGNGPKEVNQCMEKI